MAGPSPVAEQGKVEIRPPKYQRPHAGLTWAFRLVLHVEAESRMRGLVSVVRQGHHL